LLVHDESEKPKKRKRGKTAVGSKVIINESTKETTDGSEIRKYQMADQKWMTEGQLVKVLGSGTSRPSATLRQEECKAARFDDQRGGISIETDLTPFSPCLLNQPSFKIILPYNTKLW